jgi:hypothetical protein
MLDRPLIYKLKLTFLCFISLLLSNQVLAQNTNFISQKPKTKTFIEWCKNRNSIAPEAKRTVEV